MSRRPGKEVLTWVFWINLVIILGWALAKSFGLIHTPTVVEMLPLMSAVFALGAFFQRFSYMEKDFYEFKKETKEERKGFNAEMDNVQRELNDVQRELHGLNIRLDSHAH